jgi:hypothetical protein
MIMSEVFSVCVMCLLCVCPQRESDKSYEMYMKAYEEAKGQREIELMCLYEISQLHLLFSVVIVQGVGYEYDSVILCYNVHRCSCLNFLVDTTHCRNNR